jgi:hypothetical protein
MDMELIVRVSRGTNSFTPACPSHLSPIPLHGPHTAARLPIVAFGKGGFTYRNESGHLALFLFNLNLKALLFIHHWDVQYETEVSEAFESEPI